MISSIPEVFEKKKNFKHQGHQGIVYNGGNDVYLHWADVYISI